MSTDDNRCNKCGGFKNQRGAPAASGRITQWVFACTCSSTDVPESKGEAVSTVICRLCGKCIQQGRVGSFTQWVFRSDLCSCETPEPVVTEAVFAQSAVGEPIKLIDESQPELDVPTDKFPLERYKPISIMGSGASGVVYQCIDRMLNKRVAIKSLHVIDPTQLVAFQQEAITTSNLRHDNLVKILDFGATEGGSPYMVMDFVHGVNLKTLIDEKGVLGPWQAVYLAYRLARGLEHAHSQGIFHRDIKCSNILVTETPTGEPEPVLIDFGVAQFKASVSSPGVPDSDANANKTGMVGSPLYMAPDQAMGLQYDARSEVYSLGCCLFESLTGTVPFHGNSALETMSMHAHQAPPTLAEALLYSSLGSKFSDDLERAVAKCLAKDPDERFQSAQELASTLREILDSGELVPQKEGVVEHPHLIEFAMPEVSGKAKVIVAVIGGLILVALSAPIFNRTFQKPAEIEEKKFEVDGLDNFGRETEKTLLNSAKDGPFGTTVDFDLINDPEDKTKKKPAAGGTFRTYAAPKTMGVGSEMTVGEGEITDADFAKLKGKKIDHLIVHSKFVTGSGLKYLSGTGVRSVDFGRTKLDDNGMKELSKIPTIVSVNLEFTPITDKGISYIADMPITLMVLKRTKITDKSLETIKKIRQLGTLIIAGCTGVTESGIMSLKDMPSLVVLDCSKMNFPNNLEGIENFHKLNHLVLSDTNIDDRAIAHIVKIPTLTLLIVNKTKVTDFIFGLLPRLSHLDTLGLLECDDISADAIERYRRKYPHIKLDAD